MPIKFKGEYLWEISQSMRKLFSSHLVFFLLLSICNMQAIACTRILYAAKGQAVIAGRTMDWTDDLNTNLRVYPRGIERDGMAGQHSLKWRSKYASINAISYGAENTDGMNEKGLAAHMLWLDAADYGKRNLSQAGLSVILWVQYYLDNFATVADAVSFSEKHSFQLVDLAPNQQLPAINTLTVHLALEDAQGDSAVFEYIAGKLKIYHNPHYNVLTNDPTYDQQLINLKRYAGLGGKQPLPGTVDPKDRFVRATYDLTNLPLPKDYATELAEVNSVLQNIAEPYSVVNAEISEPIPTYWRTIANLTQQKYYFGASNRLNIIWANLHDFDLAAGAPVMQLNMKTSEELTGNVRAKFKPLN